MLHLQQRLAADLSPRTALYLRSAKIRFDDLGLDADFRRQSVGNQPAAVEHRDAIAGLHHHAHIVLDQQHAQSGAGELAQQRGQARFVGGRKSGGRLVEQQGVGPAGQRARDFHQAPVDEGQVVCAHLGVAVEADQRQQVVDAPRVLAWREREAQVVAHRQRGEHLRSLEGAGHAGPRQTMRRQTRQGRLATCDRACIGAVEPADQVEQRGLARAVRADQSAYLACRDVERHVLHRLHAAEGDGQPAHAHHALARATLQPRQRVRGIARVDAVRPHGRAFVERGQAFGAQPQDDQQQHTEYQQAVFGQR